jgi:hypothetical protein
MKILLCRADDDDFQMKATTAREPLTMLGWRCWREQVCPGSYRKFRSSPYRIIALLENREE